MDERWKDRVLEQTNKRRTNERIKRNEQSRKRRNQANGRTERTKWRRIMTSRRGEKFNIAGISDNFS